MEINRVFANNIRRLRRCRGLSQEALADTAGLHRTYVGAVERGERNITLLNANRIAEALGVSLSDCLKETHD
ncbi:MAG: helix-turn-helix transcriptional regulator [Chloroflexi bacterium]|nr:helix-turn-helix transcriptional regulator [Chloroflexota bacterium]